MSGDPTIITRQSVKKRLVLVAGAAIAAAIVVGGTTGAISSQAAEAQSPAPAHFAPSGAQVQSSLAGAYRTEIVAAAQQELDNARGALAYSAGKASPDVLAALNASIDSLRFSIEYASADNLLAAIMSLREAEKAATESADAWQRAEEQRLAAEAAQAAAAQQAAEAASVSSFSSSSSSRSAAAPSSVPAARAAVQSPAPAAQPPANDGCGPCPGATLVPITYDGQTFWGCP